jgi:predicted metal-dependent phosphoesterase TrpH
MKLYYDFHLHSCLSPCADNDMTPANIAAMCALAGLNVVALTDHNSTGNCAAFCEACARHGLLGLPGMELTTAEEVHVLCLLPDLDAAAAFGRLVHSRQTPITNDSRIFGAQIYMDSRDGVLGEEERLLLTATDIGIDAAAALVSGYGGIAFPAHINRPSFSLLSNLGRWDSTWGFHLAEYDRNCEPDFQARHFKSTGVPLITGSDAHALDQICAAQCAMTISETTPQAVLRWICHKKGGTGHENYS